MYQFKKIVNLKKAISLLLIFALLVSIIPVIKIKANALEEPTGYWTDYVSADAPELDGTTYMIDSAEDLAWIANRVDTGEATFKGFTIKLSKDIELTNHYWVPIGQDNTLCFKGIFDGNDKTIFNLTVAPSNYKDAGLFGYTEDVRIINLMLSNIIISTSTSGDIGCLIGYAGKATTLDNIRINGNVSETKSPAVGGIVGSASSVSITNSYANVIINGGNATNFNQKKIGGLIGAAGEVSIYNDYSLGSITCQDDNILSGGLVALADKFNINHSYSSSNIYVGNTSVIGGLVGSSEFSHNGGQISYITNCYYNGNMICGDSSFINYMVIPASIGGIIGCYYDVQVVISNCYTGGTFSGGKQSYVAGIAGCCAQVSFSYITISNSFSSCNLEGGDNANVDGLIGEKYTETSVSGYWNVDKTQIINNKKIDTQSKIGKDSQAKTSQEMKSSSFKELLNSFVASINSKNPIVVLETWKQISPYNEGYPIINGVGDGVNQEPIAVQSFMITTKSTSLDQYESADISYTIEPQNATNKKVLWSSSDENVARVVNGTIYPNKSGTAEITGKTLDGYYTDSCTVTVNPIDSIVPVTNLKINKTKMYMQVGDVSKITATIEPSNSSDRNVMWTNGDNDDIATVDKYGNVTAHKAGVVDIQAAVTDGDHYFWQECPVYVSDKPVHPTSISLQDSLTITQYESAVLSCSILPADATNKSVVWTSNAPNIATVVDGIVYTHNPGTAVITVGAEDGGLTDTCTVTVSSSSAPPVVVGENSVPKSSYDILVTNETGSEPIPSATVTIEGVGTKTTDSNGKADFDNLSSSLNGTDKKLLIAASGYQTKEVIRRIDLGSCIHVLMNGDTGLPYIKSLILNTSYDLLSGLESYNLIDDKGVELKLDATADFAGNTEGKFQLIQDGKAVAQSTNGHFDFKIGDVFSCDKPVYARVVNADGVSSNKVLTGIRITNYSSSGSTTGGFSFGTTNSITVPEDVPIIGNSTINLGFDDIPVQVDVEDGTVRIALGVKDEVTSWDNFEDDFAKVVQGRVDAAKAFGGSPSPYHAGVFDANAAIVGYGEGVLDKDTVTINVKLVVSVDADWKHDSQIFIAYVPVYVEVGAEVSASDTLGPKIVLQQKYNSQTGKMEYKLDSAASSIAEGTFSSSLSAHIGAGVGVANVLSVGGEGELGLNYDIDFTNDHITLDATGSLSLTANALLFTSEKKIAEQTWNLYDNKKPVINSDMVSANLYNANSYSLMHWPSETNGANMMLDSEPLDTFNKTSTITPDTTAILDSDTFVDANPRLVNVGGTPYLFWLTRNKSRADQDCTMLVYSYYNGTSWSSPAAIDGDDGTADFGFDIAVEGTTVYVAWQNLKTTFSSDITLEDYAKESEIELAKIDSSDNSISTSRLTNDDVCDLLPHIGVSNGAVITSWYTNSENDIFGQSGSNTIKYTYSSAGLPTAADVIELITTPHPVISLDAGFLNNQFSIAYVLDNNNDYSTISDRDISLSQSGNAPVIVTGDNIADSNPQFAALNSENTLFWYSGGNIDYLTDNQQQPQAVFTSSVATLSDRFTVLSNNAATKIVWKPASAGDEQTLNTYSAVSFDGSGWSSAYTLVQAGTGTSAPSGYINTEGNSILTYTSTENSLTKLCISDVVPSADIHLIDVFFADDTDVPGKNLPLNLDVENNGHKDINTMNINIYNGNDLIYNGTLNGLELKTGETRQLSLTDFTLPDSINTITSLMVEASVPGEGDLRDNQANFEVGYPDLSVNAEANFENGAGFLMVNVSNLSAYSTGGTLTIRSGSEDGNVLLQKHYGNLSATDGLSLVYDLQALLHGNQTKFLYISIASDGKEYLSGNNSMYLNISSSSDQMGMIYSVNCLENATINQTNQIITSHVNSDRLTIDVTTSEDDTWSLYSDSKLLHEINDNSITLNPGINTYYINVVSPNGASKLWTLELTSSNSGGCSLMVDSAVFQDSIVSATVSITNSMQQIPATLVAAAYDSNGRLIGITSQYITVATGTTSQTLDISGIKLVNAKTVKVFLIGNGIGFTPIAQSMQAFVA